MIACVAQSFVSKYIDEYSSVHMFVFCLWLVRNQDSGVRLPDVWHTCFHSCDINSDSLEILQNDPHGPHHIFVGLLQQLPKHA